LITGGAARFAHSSTYTYLYSPLTVDFGGTGSEAEINLSGVAGNTTAKIEMSKSDGTAAVPYDSLSGGAREQLGILARLAGAALVAKEDTVPVIIDDALGFTDSDRLTKMAAVFNTVGTDGQVILLTCSPDRYVGIKAAEVIDLSP
jgi:uncharacterized protein YhaN